MLSSSHTITRPPIMTLRTFTIFTICLLLMLELIFSLWAISGNFSRPFSLFDIQLAVVALLLLTQSNSVSHLFLDLDFDFWRMTVLYKVYFIILIYMLLLKSTYFLGYLAGTIDRIIRML